jgi:acyl-CoA thioester hydrolase
MPEFRFYYPIDVRYGDLDPQGHLNNAKYLTYIEQARIHYIKHLGLWDGGTFFNIGIILADVHLIFRSPIHFGQPVRVGVRVSRLGNKSLNMEYRLEDASDGQELARGSTVSVAYNYHERKTIPLPESWRKAITTFESLGNEEP